MSCCEYDTLDRIRNTSFSASVTNGPNKIVHYTRMERVARDKHSSLLNPFLSYEKNELS